MPYICVYIYFFSLHYLLIVLFMLNSSYRFRYNTDLFFIIWGGVLSKFVWWSDSGFVFQSLCITALWDVKTAACVRTPTPNTSVCGARRPARVCMSSSVPPESRRSVPTPRSLTWVSADNPKNIFWNNAVILTILNTQNTAQKVQAIIYNFSHSPDFSSKNQ